MSCLAAARRSHGHSQPQVRNPYVLIIEHLVSGPFQDDFTIFQYISPIRDPAAVLYVLFNQEHRYTKIAVNMDHHFKDGLDKFGGQSQGRFISSFPGAATRKVYTMLGSRYLSEAGDCFLYVLIPDQPSLQRGVS
jgi:hypothetical protein